MSKGKFKLGDPVEWISQSAGFLKKKRGVVAGIVVKDADPYDTILSIGKTVGGSSRYGGGTPRNHESYIVVVPGRTIRASIRIYWPLVNQLKKINSNHVTWDLKAVMDMLDIAEKDFFAFSWDLVPKHPKYVRYYVMYGEVCKRDRGFRTREEVDAWIERFGSHIVRQDAKTLTFLLNDLNSDTIKIVDKNGEVYQR